MFYAMLWRMHFVQAKFLRHNTPQYLVTEMV